MTLTDTIFGSILQSSTNLMKKNNLKEVRKIFKDVQFQATFNV